MCWGAFFLQTIMKEFAKQFYNSKKWKSCRQSFIDKRISIDGGMCQICKQVPGYIVHHITSLTPDNITDADVSLNHCNLQYVCHSCHNDEHSDVFKYGSSGLKCKLDHTGRVIPEHGR